MSIEENRRIVGNIFKRASGALEGDPFQDFASDCIYWIAGELAPRGSKLSGTYHGIDAIRGAATATFGAVVRVESYEIIGITAEGDRVAVEAERRQQHQRGDLGPGGRGVADAPD